MTSFAVARPCEFSHETSARRMSAIPGARLESKSNRNLADEFNEPAARMRRWGVLGPSSRAWGIEQRVPDCSVGYTTELPE